MQIRRQHTLTAALAFAPLLALPAVAQAAIVANPTPSPQCGDNKAFFNPTLPPDISLPVEDGYALLAKVRALPRQRGGSVPAIAMTANVSERDP